MDKGYIYKEDSETHEMFREHIKRTRGKIRDEINHAHNQAHREFVIFEEDQVLKTVLDDWRDNKDSSTFYRVLENLIEDEVFRKSVLNMMGIVENCDDKLITFGIKFDEYFQNFNEIETPQLNEFLKDYGGGHSDYKLRKLRNHLKNTDRILYIGNSKWMNLKINGVGSESGIDEDVKTPIIPDKATIFLNELNLSIGDKVRYRDILKHVKSEKNVKEFVEYLEDKGILKYLSPGKWVVVDERIKSSESIEPMDEINNDVMIKDESRDEGLEYLKSLDIGG